MENKKIAEKMVDVWDNKAPSKGRHCENTNVPALNQFYDLHMLPDCVDFKGKVVVNYGCGGGWLEKKLFQEYDIKKSISFDISHKSVAFAAENLADYNAEVKLIEPWEMMKSVARRKKDIFMSCECIQHFPTEEYFDSWLKMLNRQKYEWIILHYKIIDKKKVKKTQFRENIYATLIDSNRACITETKFLEDRLTNYELVEVVPNKIKALREASYWRLK